jgi:hypothetical protein
MNSGTTALQNGAFQTNALQNTLSHNGYMKIMEIYENNITLFCLEKNQHF